MLIDQPPVTRKRNNDPREPQVPKSQAEQWKLEQVTGEDFSEPQTPRIYKDLAHDPDVLEVHERVMRLSEVASSDEERTLIYNQQWGAFEKTHPEKAAAYRQTAENKVPEPDEIVNYEEVSVPDATTVFNEVIEYNEQKASEELAVYKEAEKNKQEVRDRLYKSSHQEAMHFLAQEENGIEEPATLKEHMDNLESLTVVYNEKIRAKEEQDVDAEARKDVVAPSSEEGKKWSEMNPKEKAITMGKWAGGIGGAAALTGVGIWANASILGAVGLGPSSAAVGLSMAGIGAGAAFVGSMILGDIFYWQLIKNLWTEGSAWIKKISGGNLGSGHSSAPKAKPSGGGSAHH
jgi:hypothetical protein